MLRIDDSDPLTLLKLASSDMHAAVCPDEPTLQRLLLGCLPAEQAGQLESHLLTCDRCVELASRLLKHDDLIDAVVSAAQSPTDNQSASHLIKRLKAMQAESIHTHLDETKAKPSTSVERDQTVQLPSKRLSGKELSFLNPPESEGEIGRLGRFRVLEILGRGGMGVVLKADDTKLKRDVAIKVLNAICVDHSEAVARFLREAQATAAIEHDNIVTIHDVGEQHGMPYYAMQFLRGESLQSRLRSERPLSLVEAVRIAREIAEGLSAAHAKGLLHRDIKPANIWLEAATDRVKIVDFGLARLDDHDDSDLTNSGAILGTPKYMSPEQAQGMAVDHRCDLFSLGSVLFHLVAGQAPFSGSNVTATLVAVASHSHADVREHSPECPNSLCAVIDRLLEKAPADRFASADEVVAALQGIEAELSVVAPAAKPHPLPPTPVANAGKRVAWGVLAAMVPLVILFGVFLFRTPNGALRVEVSDPNLEVFIDGDELKLTDKVWKGKKNVGNRRLKIKLGDQELKIGPETLITVGGDEGKHRLSVQINETKLSSNEFEITRNKETVLTIGIVPVENRANEAFAQISTGGLIEEATLKPIGKPPNAWRRDGVFAEIKGIGALTYPRLPVKQFALDIELEVRDPSSDLLIVHGAPADRWRSEIRLAHTPPDVGGTLLRILPMRRKGGLSFMPGHTNAPLNKKFRLTIVANGDSQSIYVNGEQRLRVQSAQPDLHLTLAANSRSADATIYSMKYRPLSADEKATANHVSADRNATNDELHIGDDWPEPIATPRYQHNATGEWEEVEITDAMMRAWERLSAGKLATKRLQSGDVQMVGDTKIVLPEYEARNTILRVQFEPMWIDDHDYIALGVRHRDGHVCEAVLEADGEFRLNAGPRYYLTHREFKKRYQGSCELAIAAIDNQLSAYMNGQLLLTTTKTALRTGSPVIDLNAGMVLKQIEVMVLSDAPNATADPIDWPTFPAEPDYAGLAKGDWQKIEFTDELIAQWEALDPKLVRVARLENGGVRVMGPHTAIFDLPGFDSRDVLMRAKVFSHFRNGNSFAALRTRRKNNTSYAVSLHPKSQLRAGYDFPRWHQSSHIDFPAPTFEPVELAMANVGPWVRGYVNGKEIASNTNWHFDEGTVALQTHGCVDFLSIEVMRLDDEATRTAIRKRISKEEATPETSPDEEPADVAKPLPTPQRLWPREKEKPDYQAIAKGTWRPIEISKETRQEWQDYNGVDHFTKTTKDGSLEFIGSGRCVLPEHLQGRNILMRAELTQLWGDPEEWVALELRGQPDKTRVGSHLNCALHVNTGSFPRDRWTVEQQKSFDQTYDGRIEFVLAAVDETVSTFINGKQVTSFATTLQDAGRLSIRHDGPFVLHKLEYMNLDREEND